MRGIYPNQGVLPGTATNGVDVPSTCEASKRFYSSPTCTPRFDPAAMNALISEILNVVNGAGLTYDCGALNNLLLAINTLAQPVSEAVAGTAIRPGFVVRSSDGDLYWNCTAGDVTPAAAANITSAGLAALGMCPMNATVATATAAGVDTFGNAIAIGNQVITFVNGDTLVIGAGGGGGGGQTDTFTSANGTIANAGDNVNLDLDVVIEATLDQTPVATPAELANLDVTDEMLVQIDGVWRQIDIADLPLPPAPQSLPDFMDQQAANFNPGGLNTTTLTVAGLNAASSYIWHVSVGSGGTGGSPTASGFTNMTQSLPNPGGVNLVHSGWGTVNAGSTTITVTIAGFGSVYGTLEVFEV